MWEEAWKLLEESIIYYQGRPIGTVAAQDREVKALNYDQCFIRDFVPCALVFLMHGRTEIVRNFLVETLAMQSHDKGMDCFEPVPGLMPASFKVEHDGEKEFIEADFGEDAIARVTPVDSCLWWILLLRAYVKATGDIALAHQFNFQTGMKLILDLCLVHRFSMYPTLPVLDGAFMIDRRMGVGGHPLEIQVLFYATLRTVKELLLPQNGGERYLDAVNQRLGALNYHIREYYWLDLKRLNEMYRFKNDEFGN